MKPGSKEKDHEIKDGFNRNKRGVTEEDIRKAKRAAAQDEVRRASKQKELDIKIAKVSNQIQTLKDRLSVLRAEAGYEDVDEAAPAAFSASAMLEQMWKVYRQAGGLKRLKSVMADSKEFRAMAKDMLKVEAAISKTKKDEVNQGQTVFVILKGLQTEQDVYKGSLDLGQIRGALDPTVRPAIEVDKGVSAPVQLQKPVEMVG